MRRLNAIPGVLLVDSADAVCEAVRPLLTPARRNEEESEYHVCVTDAAQRFPEGRSDDVDLADQIVMLRGASAALAEHAGGVGVIHHQHGVVPAAQLDQVRQRRDGALHREDAVGDYQSGAAVASGGELGFEIRQVGVAVHGSLALDDRLGETGRVDDGGVVELVADHDVGFAE